MLPFQRSWAGRSVSCRNTLYRLLQAVRRSQQRSLVVKIYRAAMHETTVPDRGTEVLGQPARLQTGLFTSCWCFSRPDKVGRIPVIGMTSSSSHSTPSISLIIRLHATESAGCIGAAVRKSRYLGGTPYLCRGNGTEVRRGYAEQPQQSQSLLVAGPVR